MEGDFKACLSPALPQQHQLKTDRIHQTLKNRPLKGTGNSPIGITHSVDGVIASS